jgi:plasmid stability protein
MNAGHLTVRNVPPKVIAALQAVRRRRGASLNQTVIDLLRQALGIGGPRRSGLARFAGGWSAAQLREFEDSTAAFEEVDPELWR